MPDTCKHCGAPIEYCAWDNTGQWYHVTDWDAEESNPVSCSPDWRDTVAEPV